MKSKIAFFSSFLIHLMLLVANVLIVEWPLDVRAGETIIDALQSHALNVQATSCHAPSTLNPAICSHRLYAKGNEIIKEVIACGTTPSPPTFFPINGTGKFRSTVSGLKLTTFVDSPAGVTFKSIFEISPDFKKCSYQPLCGGRWIATSPSCTVEFKGTSLR